MSGIFSGKKSKTDKTASTPEYPTYNQAEKDLGQKAIDVIPTLGNAYGGQLTADQNAAQQSAYSSLLQFVNSPSYLQDPMYQQGKGLMSDVLSGKYLGQQSPYETAVTQQFMSQTLPEMQNKLNANLALRGTFSTGYGGQMEEKMMNDAGMGLATMRGQEYDKQLANQFNMISPALQLAQSEQYAPAQAAQTAYGLGGIQQSLDQAPLTAQLQEFLRQRQEQLMPITQAGSMAGPGSQLQQYDYSFTPGTNSTWSKYISPVLGMMGPYGQAAAGIGNMFANDYGNSPSPLSQLNAGSSAGGASASASGNPFASLMSWLNPQQSGGYADNTGQAQASMGGSMLPAMLSSFGGFA